MSIRWDGQQWADGVANCGPRCVVIGSDDSIARLMLRRLEVGDPQLIVEDSANLATQLVSAIRPL